MTPMVCYKWLFRTGFLKKNKPEKIEWMNLIKNGFYNIVQFRNQSFFTIDVKFELQ